jgi:hypothetical protein
MKKLISLIIGIVMAISCSKNSVQEETVDVLPPITEIGANTAGVEINGYVLIPKDGTSTGYLQYGSLIKGLEAKFGQNFISTQGNSYFDLTIKNLERDNGYFFSLELDPVNQIGTITTGSYLIGPRLYIGKEVNGSVQQQFYSRANSFNVVITKLDFISKIVSGTFSGDVFDVNNNKLELKNGRFDVKMQ